ncbi:MAG: type VI secretion system tip protein VgrG, partial [Acidobacteriia bacterium]|nr:type VI secretion system tip protein VgrG [Terriglobia bacterium]
DGNSAYEIYDYPGEYLNKAQGSSLAKLRMQEEETTSTVVQGTSECRAFVSGFKFDLADHYRRDANAPYLLTQVQHVATEGDTYLSGGTEKGEHYSNHFTCIPAHVSYRPLRRTPRPFVQGPQTAVVVGKSGEEIWVDKYGRVKVQFFWDREGKKDENSSCWVRVSQPWAGKNWGAIWIPRIGQEVIVDFLEGDPDRPLITGRVYNADQMPPYELPTNQTQSGFKSRSSKQGGAANYNEIRFEDKKGKELLLIHAELNKNESVECDSTEFVGRDRLLTVKRDQKELVERDKHQHVKGVQRTLVDIDNHIHIKGNQKTYVQGNNNVHVKGDHLEKIDGNRSLSVSGARDEKFGTKAALEAGQEVHIKGGLKVVIEGGMQVTLKGPGGFVDISPMGVTIQGTMVLINSGGAAGAGSGSSPGSPEDPEDPTDPGAKEVPKE